MRIFRVVSPRRLRQPSSPHGKNAELPTSGRPLRLRQPLSFSACSSRKRRHHRVSAVGQKVYAAVAEGKVRRPPSGCSTACRSRRNWKASRRCRRRRRAPAASNASQSGMPDPRRIHFAWNDSDPKGRSNARALRPAHPCPKRRIPRCRPARSDNAPCPTIPNRGQASAGGLASINVLLDPSTISVSRVLDRL